MFCDYNALAARESLKGNPKVDAIVRKASKEVIAKQRRRLLTKRDGVLGSWTQIKAASPWEVTNKPAL